MNRFTIEVDYQNRLWHICDSWLHVFTDYMKEDIFPETDGVDPIIIEIVRLANIGAAVELKERNQ